MRAWRTLATAVALAVTSVAVGQPGAIPANPLLAQCELARSIVSLEPDDPTAFVLRYRGPLTPWHGPLCYHFAGYNPTCRPIADAWLTPASRFTFNAPGQVPADLLQGFRLVLSAPQMFEGTLLFDKPTTRSNHWSATPPESWNCRAH